MTLTFIYLIVILKIPVFALLYIVWWAAKEPDPADEPGGEGGSGVRPHPHPRAPLPRHPRRGPHGDRRPAAPPRMRAVVVKARRVER